MPQPAENRDYHVTPCELREIAEVLGMAEQVFISLTPRQENAWVATWDTEEQTR